MGKGCIKKPRNLILVFGDQLDAGSAAFDGFDTAEDTVLMMEVEEEATYIPQHRIRLTFFFTIITFPAFKIICAKIQTPVNLQPKKGQ